MFDEQARISLVGGVDFHDTEQLSHALRHTEVSAVQISKGAFHATLGCTPIGEWMLQTVAFTQGVASCSGKAAPDRHTFLVPNFVDGNFKLLGRELSDTTIGIYAPGGEHADVSGAGLVEFVLSPPADLIDRALERGEVMNLPGHGSELRSIPGPALKHLKNVLQNIAATTIPGRGGVEYSRAMSDVLENALLAVVTETATTVRPGRQRQQGGAVVLRRVQEAMQQSDWEALYVSELANSTGVSYPTLHRIFIDLFGMSPNRYLALKRLYKARRGLLSGEYETVSEAATSCGFWELGRFAQAYRHHFGELPSQALSNTRSHAQAIDGR